MRGRLEDLPLLDMLQIAAFSQKSGYLRVSGTAGRGAVVFRSGLVPCAYSWSTADHVKRVASEGADEATLERLVELSLQELATLREGVFEFELADEIASELDGVDITPFVTRQGVNVQHLLLDLARDMDEERRDAMAIIETSDTVVDLPSPLTVAPPPVEAPSEVARDFSVVLVDDEPDIVDIVGDELERNGFAVARASSPLDGLALVEERHAAARRVVVVSDLKMPTSDGESFHGGFELVKRLNRLESRPSVLLMTEVLTPDDRMHAIELGIRKAAFKPTLTKPDPVQYRADLIAFTGEILKQLDILGAQAKPATEPSPPPPETEERAAEPLDYLASMSQHILNHARQTDITRIVLQVATRYMERGILFLVKKKSAVGLAAFGISDDEAESIALARQLHVPIEEASPFLEVLTTKAPFGPTDCIECLEPSVYDRVGRGEAREAILMPMLNNGEVLTILYGDNANTGKKMNQFRGLELMLAQAGMALENALLQQKLKALGGSLPTEDVPV